MDYAAKLIVGTGAAINVELGFIPDKVVVTNVEDRDEIFHGILTPILNFTSGGTDEIMGGMLIVQGDALGTWAKIKEVLLKSGTWAAGDAAGYLVLEPGVGNGAIAASKTLRVAPARQNPLFPPSGAAGNWATSGSTPYLTTDIKIAAAVAAGAATETIAAYIGTIPNAPTLGVGRGVTLGVAISESDKLFLVEGFRMGAG